MTTKKYAGPPLFSGALRRDDVASGAEAAAKIPRILRDNAIIWHGLMSGTALEAPPNSRGLFGEDHSGSGYGRPITHTYYSISALSAPDYDGGVAANTAPGVRIVNYEDVGATVQPHYYWDATISVPVPSCFPSGAYDEAHIEVLWDVIQLYTGQATLWANLTITNETTSVSRTMRVNGGSGGTVGYATTSVSMRMDPGRINRVRMVGLVDAITGTRDAGVVVRIPSISFSQPNGDDDGS